MPLPLGLRSFGLHVTSQFCASKAFTNTFFRRLFVIRAIKQLR